MAVDLGDWLDRLGRRAVAVRLEGDPGMTVRVGVQVTGDTPRDWCLRIGGGRVDVLSGALCDADVVLRMDGETATALASGDISPNEALSAGRVRLRGRVEALAESSDLLAEAAFELSGATSPEAASG